MDDAGALRRLDGGDIGAGEHSLSRGGRRHHAAHGDRDGALRWQDVRAPREDDPRLLLRTRRAHHGSGLHQHLDVRLHEGEYDPATNSCEASCAVPALVKYRAVWGKAVLDPNELLKPRTL